MTKSSSTVSDNTSESSRMQAGITRDSKVSAVFQDALDRSELNLIPYRLHNKPNEETKFCKIDSDEIHALSFQDLSGGMVKKLRKLFEFATPFQIQHFDKNDKYTLVYFVRAPVHEINIFTNALESEYCAYTSFGGPVDAPTSESPYYLDAPCKKKFADGKSVIDVYELSQFEMLLDAEIEDDEVEEGLSADYTIVNDAKIYGTPSQEVEDLEIAVAFGEDAHSKVFKGVTGNFQLLMENYFFKHLRGNKDGKCIVFGELINKRRIKTEVKLNSAIGLDVDSGESLHETFKKLKDIGLTALFYTTHSHNKSGIEIKKDAYLNWAEKEGHPPEPTTENVKEFLKNQGKYVDRIIDGCEFVKPDHLTGGMKLIIDTPKIEKFRIIIPLKTPYIYSEQVMTHRDSIFQWEKIVSGLGAALGIKIDRATRDPSRLFYLPRHPKGGDFEVLLNYGALLDWEDVKQVDPREEVTGDAFAQAGSALGGGSGNRPTSPSGIDLKTWAYKFAEGFQIASLLQDHANDKVRVDQGQGKFTVECPFDENHSNAGDPEDPGCYVKNPEADGDTFIFKCSHDGCFEKDRLDLLEKAMKDGWFSDEYLEDPFYDNIDRTAEAEAEEADCQAAYEAAKTAVEDAAENKNIRPSQAIKSVLELCLALETDDAEEILAIIKKKFPSSKIESLRKQLADLSKKKAAKSYENNSGTEPSIALSKNGDLNFSKSSEYKKIRSNDGQSWIATLEGALLFQDFKITNIAENKLGSEATIFVEFDAAGISKRFSFKRSQLYDSRVVVKLFVDRSFVIKTDCEDELEDFFKKLQLPIDTLLVERTGWNEERTNFLHPSGESIQLNSDAQKVLPKELSLTPFRRGNLEAWREGVEVICKDGAANGCEHFAFGLITGGAGPIRTYYNDKGFLLLSIHGPSSRGKTSSAKLAYTLAGQCALHTFNKTSNSLEGLMPNLSGLTIVLDETKNLQSGDFSSIVWKLAEGEIKQRMQADLTIPSVRTFGGFCIMSTEVPISQLILQRQNIIETQGFHARLCDIDVSDIPPLIGSRKRDVLRAVKQCENNSGNALEPFIIELSKYDVDEVQERVEHYASELAGPNANDLSIRSAEIIALSKLSGELMIDAGLIPLTYDDVDRLCKWAWSARLEEAAKDPFYIAMETLCRNSFSGGKIADYEDFSTGAKYQETIALRHESKSPMLYVSTKHLSEICGGNSSNESLAKEMKKRGLIKLEGGRERPSHSKLPNGTAWGHYRVELNKVQEFLDKSKLND